MVRVVRLVAYCNYFSKKKSFSDNLAVLYEFSIPTREGGCLKRKNGVNRNSVRIFLFSNKY